MFVYGEGGKGMGIDRLLTTDCWLLVLLKVVVDKAQHQRRLAMGLAPGNRKPGRGAGGRVGNAVAGHTFPTAASPSSTSLTLLLGLGALSAIVFGRRSRKCPVRFAGNSYCIFFSSLAVGVACFRKREAKAFVRDLWNMVARSFFCRAKRLARISKMRLDNGAG